MVFADQKKLFKKNEIDHIDVPHYDELSVKKLWPQFKKDQNFMQYFPDSFADTKGPARQYFFDIMNTIYPEYLN